MTALTIVDTDILIDVGRNENKAVDYLAQLEKDTTLVISAITQMELIVGCRNKAELREVNHFLRRYHIMSVDEAISTKAVELLLAYRLSHGLLIADALIAATAIVFETPFASKNQRHYRFISELKLLPYL